MRKLSMEARRKIRADYATREDVDARIVRALLDDADHDEKAASSAKYQARMAAEDRDRATKDSARFEREMAKGDVVPRSLHQSVIGDITQRARGEIERYRRIAMAAEEALRVGGIVPAVPGTEREE